MTTRVLVTGASGFAGEHLARRLVGHCRVLGTWHSHPISVPGIEWRQVNLAEPGAVAELIRGARPDLIFHCAAVTDVALCERDRVLARAGIVTATQLLADAARRHGCGALIALSTDLVFAGDQGFYCEEDLPHPLSVYGRLKLEAEAPVLDLPRGVVLRTALFYGPPATHRGSFLAWMLRSLEQGERLELFEDEFRTPIAIEDLLDAMIAAGEQGLTGLWHCGGPERLSRLEMGRAVCRVWNLDPGLIDATRLAASRYPAPRPRDVSLDSSRLWSRIGQTPAAFSEGLRSIHHALIKRKLNSK